MEDKTSYKDTNKGSSILSRLTMKNFKCCTISINWPLVPLKLALFCWYGAGSFMPSFLTLLFKQRGVTLSELSAMTIFAPIVQVAGTAVSGVVADKLGRSKPVMVVNVLLVTSVVTGILLLPKIDKTLPVKYLISATCHPKDPHHLLLQTRCDVQHQNYSIFCSSNLTYGGSGKSLTCKEYIRDEIERNLPFAIYLNNNSYWNSTGDKCSYDVSLLPYQRTNISLCYAAPEISCVVCCTTDSDSKCSEDIGFSNLILMAYAVLFVLFLTTYSNTYRCFDITVMSLVKEYNSDFGHERFFSILGNLAMSPIAGIIAHVATPDGEEKNYAAPLYLFLGLNCILLIIVYKLPVVLTTPGDKMWKKSFKLLKSIDVLMFLITILILGTSFNFTKFYTFWYLEELDAPSLLIGLIPSVGALYGLPFLLTSKWWVKKLGTHQLFIMGLLSYVACSVGYSFLRNPWISLILELHGAISYYLVWVAVVEHSHYIAPEGLTATFIAIAGAIHYSAGKSISGVIGGMVMSEFGAVVAFRLLAIICSSVAVLYALYRCIRNKHNIGKHQLDKKDESKENIQTRVIFTFQDKT